MQTGTIVELVDRDFGFIKRVGVTDTLFFHSDALIGITFKELKKGDTLTFEITQSLKGPYAIKVKRT